MLQGHHFKVETLPEAPYTSKMELNPYTGKYEIEGSFSDLLKGLAVAMNFTYTVTPPPDGAWGGYDGNFPDGTWNGMMNEVVNERIDFGKNTPPTYATPCNIREALGESNAAKHL